MEVEATAVERVAVMVEAKEVVAKVVEMGVAAMVVVKVGEVKRVEEVLAEAETAMQTRHDNIQ
jgi:hypothetical protein